MSEGDTQQSRMRRVNSWVRGLPLSFPPSDRSTDKQSDSVSTTYGLVPSGHSTLPFSLDIPALEQPLPTRYSLLNSMAEDDEYVPELDALDLASSSCSSDSGPTVPDVAQSLRSPFTFDLSLNVKDQVLVAWEPSLDLHAFWLKGFKEIEDLRLPDPPDLSQWIQCRRNTEYLVGNYLALWNSLLLEEVRRDQGKRRFSELDFPPATVSAAKKCLDRQVDKWTHRWQLLRHACTHDGYET